jgi:hypothetical protein
VLAPGAQDTVDITINRIGAFEGAVDLRIPEVFAESFFSTATFIPNPTTGNSRLALQVADTPASVEWRGGTFQFTAQGTSGSSECATAFTVTVPRN